MPEILTTIFVVPADPNIIYCSSCHVLLGEMVKIDNLPLFKTGSLITRSLHGSCICGQEFHFATNDVMLANLLRRCLNIKDV